MLETESDPEYDSGEDKQPQQQNLQQDFSVWKMFYSELFSLFNCLDFAS